MNLSPLLDWINDEPRRGPTMQRDDVFAMLSWRDIQMNKQGLGLDARTMWLMSLIAVGLPLLLIS